MPRIRCILINIIHVERKDDGEQEYKGESVGSLLCYE